MNEAVNLTNCDREPIHIPGSVQPFGFMLAVLSDFTICMASDNVGSFLGLLSYPILFEPAFTLRTQERLWSGGFVLLVAAISICGVLLLRARDTEATPGGEAAAPKPRWLTIARWVFVSAVPSGLLVAITALI